MIHTAKFYIALNERELRYLMKKYNSRDLKFIENSINCKFTYCTTTITKLHFKYMIFLNIDFIELLNKSNITEEDLPNIKIEISKYLNEVLGDDSIELTLIRIDYRMDVKIENNKHKELLFHLYKKTLDKYRFKKKYDKYDTTTYFNSKSMQVIIYDKEQERKSKKKPIKSYEENIMRLEVRLMNRHLNYQKRKNNIEKTLDNYFKKEIWKKYILGETLPLLYKGNYYKLYHAEKIINESIIKDKDKKSIREFLIDISKSSLESVKNKETVNDAGKLVKKYTTYKFRKYIKILEKLNINPILIPKNYKIKLENGCLENLYVF